MAAAIGIADRPILEPNPGTTSASGDVGNTECRGRIVVSRSPSGRVSFFPLASQIFEGIMSEAQMNVLFTLPMRTLQKSEMNRRAEHYHRLTTRPL